MKPLAQKITTYYETKSISKDRLDRILQQGEHIEATTQSTSISRRKVYSMMAVTVTVFLVVIVTQSFYWQRDLAQLVFAEIAMNHNKRLESEFATTDYKTLASAMQRLDFNLSPPNVIQSSYDLLGGRYCSIRGNIAAQLKVKDKQTGRVATLYITQLNSDLERIKPKAVIVDQVIIQLWRSEDKFYGLAVDAIN